MRIAFITSEFVTDHHHGGGLANYLNRMGKLLVERGHEVEIFLPSSLEPQTLVHEGIRVHRVCLTPPSFGQRLLRRTVYRRQPHEQFHLPAQAQQLAAAMEQRHQEAPFQLVQSADYLAVGLAVSRCPGRIHVVRCSSAADLYNKIDGNTSLGEKCREALELTAMRGADRVYAPSRYVANHFQQQHGIKVEVLRPPISMDAAVLPEPLCGLPERFLVFFGQLLKRKGIEWLGAALCQAFETDPLLRFVILGKDYSNMVNQALAGLGSHRGKVLALHPLPKPELYALLQRAEAAVLPSLVDNLPNTVIESLMLGLPVIGTRGASVDELVAQDKTGELVVAGDIAGLAAAISKVWRGQSLAKKGFTWSGDVAVEMQPDQAVGRFLALAKPDEKADTLTSVHK